MESHTTDIFISWVYETIRWKTFTIYIYFHHVLFFRSMFTFSIRLMSKGRLRLQIHHFFFFFLFFFINIIRMKKSRMIFKIVTKLMLFQGPHCYILHLWAFLQKKKLFKLCYFHAMLHVTLVQFTLNIIKMQISNRFYVHVTYDR